MALLRIGADELEGKIAVYILWGGLIDYLNKICENDHKSHFENPQPGYLLEVFINGKYGKIVLKGYG